MRSRILIAGFIASLGCGTAVTGGTGAARLPSSGEPARPQRTLIHGDARVGTYVSSRWGFTTSSYWIEGPSGLIVIDTQFLPSAAEEMLRWAEAETGKQVELAIVLHANPDKFNGTEVLQRRGIRVITSEQVRALIPGIHDKRHRAFYERYKPDYPDHAPLPGTFGSTTQTIEAAGTSLTAHVLGPGCSGAHVVVEFDGHLFTGDLVANGAHSWLEIGETEAWLERLAELRRLRPKYVHPGRGPSGGALLLDAEEAYLRKVMALVAARDPKSEPSPELLHELSEDVQAAFPGYDYPVFLRIGLPAEWARQARQAALHPAGSAAASTGDHPPPAAEHPQRNASREAGAPAR